MSRHCLLVWLMVIILLLGLGAHGLAEDTQDVDLALATQTELQPEQPGETDVQPVVPWEGSDHGPEELPERPSDETTGEIPKEPSDEQPEEQPEDEADELDARDAEGGTFNVELHTGAVFGGSGTKVTAGGSVASVTLSKTAKKLCAVDGISGKYFRILPLKTGTAKLTVVYTDGTKQTYSLRIFDKDVAYEIRLSFSDSPDGTSLLMTKPGQTVKITRTLVPSTAKDTLTYRSSNRKVASVDSSTGVITLLKTGSFTLTATASGGARVKMKLKVVDPYSVKSLKLLYNGAAPAARTTPWSISDRLKLSYRAVTWGGSGYPADASSFVWSTSSKKIAEIEPDGTVTVHRAGTVTFTLKSTHGGSKASIRFRFAPPLQSIVIGPSAVTQVRPGKTVKLKSSLNPSASSPLVSLTWYSADETVATVSSKGVVRGINEGTTWIYCKDTVSGLYARKSVIVSIPPTYRAIVAVEPTDIQNILWNDGGMTWYLDGYTKRSTDLNGIVKTLKQQNYNGHRWSISRLWKTSPAKVEAAINKAAAKANDHDITLFFFMGHGDSKGSLHFYNGTSISAAQLKQWLDRIPGRVIVMLGSCYSGTYIARSGDNGSGFTQSVISTFGVGDTVPVTFLDRNGEVKTVTKGMLTEALDDCDTGYVPRNGELRQSKYYVLTASATGEQAWSAVVFKKINYARNTFTTDENMSYSYFVRAVCRTGGWDPVDKEKLWTVGQRTLAQVYSETASYCSTGAYKSKVQVYPSGSSFIIFQH